MALFLTFYKGKHSPIHDFLQRKTGRGGGVRLTYPIIYIDLPILFLELVSKYLNSNKLRYMFEMFVACRVN